MDKLPPSVVEAVVPGGLAFVMQAALIYAMGLKLPTRQLAGAMVVSGITGGGVSLFLSEVAHLSPTAAGALGAMSGVAPAVIVPLLFVRWAAKKLGVDSDDFGSMLPQMRDAIQGQGNAPTPMPASPELNAPVPVTPESVTPDPAPNLPEVPALGQEDPHV